jgi:hypothetical protein
VRDFLGSGCPAAEVSGNKSRQEVQSSRAEAIAIRKWPAALVESTGIIFKHCATVYFASSAKAV